MKDRKDFDPRKATERRKYVRIKFKKPIIFKFKIEEGYSGKKGISYEDQAQARNISFGGMFVEIPIVDQGGLKRLVDGKDKLVVEVNMPNSASPLKAKAKVAWVGKRHKTQPPIFGVGISFEEVSDKDKVAGLMIDESLKTKQDPE